MGANDMEKITAALQANGVEETVIEQIAYSLDYEQTVTSLEARLRGGYQFEEIINEGLVTTMDFYDADSAIVITFDTELMLAQPEFEVHREGTMPVCGTNPIFLDEYPEIMRILSQMVVSGSVFPYTEISVLTKGTNDYRRVEQVGIHSIMGVPFSKRLRGFVAVVNPRRYRKYTSFLQVLSYVTVAEMNEMNLMNRQKRSFFEGGSLAQNEVYVKLLNGFELHTKEGVIREADIKSNQSIIFLTHLLSRKGSSIPQEMLLDAIWDNPEELAYPERTLKNLSYNVKKKLIHLFPDNGLLDIKRSAYSIGRRYNVITDLDLFGYKVRDIQGIRDVKYRLEKYRELLDNFTGSVLPSQDHRSLEHIDTLYAEKRAEVQAECLSLMYELGQFTEMHEFIGRIGLGRKQNPRLIYWEIKAFVGGGRLDLARKLYEDNGTLFTDTQKDELTSLLGGQ